MESIAIVFGEILMRVKLIVFTLLIANAVSPLALANLRPTVTSNISVYVDPELKNHKTYPINFGDRLEQKINILERESGIKYFIFLHKIAPSPELTVSPIFGEERGKNEVTKTINFLRKDPNFPNNKYVVIDYSRNPADPNESALNFAVSDDLLGPSMLSIFDRFMPQDAEGAIYKIASEIAVRENFGRILSSVFWILLLSVFGILVCYWIAEYLEKIPRFSLAPSFERKRFCDCKIKKWEKAIENANTIVEKVLEDGTIQFCLSLEMSKSPEVAQECLNELQHLILVAKSALEIAKRQQRLFMFEKAISTLDSEHVIERREIPLEQASIFVGMENVISLKGDLLLTKINETVTKTTKLWSTLKKYN